MEKILKYSVLRYSPTLFSGEKLNLGILFSEENTGYHSFQFTKNFQRIKNFDDTISIKDLKMLLIDLKEEVEDTTVRFDIDSFIKFYINDYCFEKTQILFYEDLEETTEQLFKSYFRFDFEKKDIPTLKEDKLLLSNIIYSTGRKPVKNKPIEGSFEENITYDIITDDYYIKLFDFDNRDLNRFIGHAKTWAWNSDHETDKDVYVMYRFSQKEPEQERAFNIIKNIFNDSKATFCSMEEGMRLLQ